MSRAALFVTALSMAACDLRAAAEDYQRRYCAEACAQPDSGAEPRADAGEPVTPTRETWTFSVLRFASVTGAPTAPVQAFLEERSISSGQVVTSDDLRARGISWPSTSVDEAHLSRSQNGLGLTLIGYQEDAGGARVVTDATTRRVGFVTRQTTDFGTAVTDAWPGDNVYAAATVDGTTFWLAGSPASGAGGVRSVARGSTGATVAIDGGVSASFILVRDGRLFTSSSRELFDWGPATRPVATPTRLNGVTVNQASAFELLDLRTDVAGLDTLYVAQSSGAAGLAKFLWADGGWLKSWETSAATSLGESTTCAGLATRTAENGVTILCVRGARGDAVVRFDDTSALDGGAPSASIVVQAAANDVFRGLGVLPP